MPKKQKNKVTKPESLLTQRELGILGLMAEGLNNTEIANVEGVTSSTIRFHVRNIFEKMRVSTREEAISLFTGEEISQPSQIKVEETGPNLKAISARQDRIWTVEQLLEACEISLDDWAITKIVANKWEGYRKNERKELHWEGGQIISGEIIDEGGLFTAPLIQVKVWLVRKEPIEVKPVVRSVKIKLSTRIKPRLSRSKTQTALILPDPHFGFRRRNLSRPLDPFHDRRALDVALQIAQEYDFDRVIWLGDMLDLPDWSDKFLRSPDMMYLTQPSVIEGAWWLAQFREAQPTAIHSVIEGNHDERLNRKIMGHVGEGYALRAADELHLPPLWSVERLLGLAGLEIDWVGGYPDNKLWLTDFLAVEHGAVAQGEPGSTSRTIARKRTYSTIFGHIHRAELTTRLVRDRHGVRSIFAFSPGFLGHLDGIVPGHKETQEWNQGIGIVHYVVDKPHAQPTYIPIEGGTALYDNQYWVARDRLDDLLDFAGPDWGF